LLILEFISFLLDLTFCSMQIPKKMRKSSPRLPRGPCLGTLLQRSSAVLLNPTLVLSCHAAGNGESQVMQLLWPFILGAFALGLDAYVLAGLLPAMSHDLNVPQASIGLGIAIFTAAYAFSAPTLSPMVAHRSTKAGLLVGLGLFTLGNILTFESVSLTALLLSRAVAGVGAGVFSPLAASTAAEMVIPSQRGRALAAVLAGLGSGTAFGVPLGLAIGKWFGWRWTIALLVALGVLAAAGVWLHRVELRRRQPISWKTRLSVLWKPHTFATVSVSFFTAFSSFGLYTYIAEVIMSRAMSEHIGLLIWLWGVGGMIGSMGIGKVIDRHLPPPRATPFLLCTIVIGFLLVGYTDSLGVAVGSFIWGLAGWASVAPQQHSLVSSEPANSVAVLAWNSSITYLGGAVGAAVGAGLLSSHFPPTMLPIFFSTGISIAIAIHFVKLKVAVGVSARA
jgi:predicted MFS family arabinose efflux permease